MKALERIGEAVVRWWKSPGMTTALVMAPIAAVAVYVTGDVLSGLLYDGYSFRDQWISELTAFGSPVRPLMVTVILVHGVLLLAFSIGLLDLAKRRSALWWIGALGVAGSTTLHRRPPLGRGRRTLQPHR